MIEQSDHSDALGFHCLIGAYDIFLSELTYLMSIILFFKCILLCWRISFTMKLEEKYFWQNYLISSFLNNSLKFSIEPLWVLNFLILAISSLSMSFAEIRIRSTGIVMILKYSPRWSVSCACPFIVLFLFYLASFEKLNFPEALSWLFI